MAITIAELQVELDLDHTQFETKIGDAERRTEAFGAREFGTPRLDLNTAAFHAKLKAAREAFAALKRETEGGTRVSAPVMRPAQTGQAVQTAQAGQTPRPSRDPKNALGDQAKSWGDIAASAAGLVGHIGALDDKTNAARLSARMMANAFQGANLKPFRETVEAMGAAADRLQTLQGAHDQTKADNTQGYLSIVEAGGDPAAFLKAVRAQESGDNFGGQIADAQARFARLAQSVAEFAQGQQGEFGDAALADRQAGVSAHGAGTEADATRAKAITADMLAVHQALPEGIKQTCAWAVSQVYDRIGIEFKTQNDNSARNLVEYARAHWAQVAAATAPPGALLAERSATANSGWHVGISLGGLKRAASNDRRPQFGSMGTGAIAFVPPGLAGIAAGTAGADPGATGSVAAVDVPQPTPADLKAIADKNRKLVANVQAIQATLAATGPLLPDIPDEPGDVTTARRKAQRDDLENAASDDPKVRHKNAGEIRADMGVAQAEDAAQSAAWGTNQAALANREFTKSEAAKRLALELTAKALQDAGGSSAAYARAAYMAGQQADLQSSDWYRAMSKTPAGKAKADAQVQDNLSKLGADYDQKQTQDYTADQIPVNEKNAQETSLLTKQAQFAAQNSGLNPKQLAEGLEALAAGQDAYNEAKKRGQSDDDAAKAAQTAQSQKQANDQLRDGVAYIQARAEATQSATEAQAALNDQLAVAGIADKGARDRQLAVLAAQRAYYNSTKTDASNPQAALDAGVAGAQAGYQYDEGAAARRQTGDLDAATESKNKVDLLQAQLAAVQSAGAGDGGKRDAGLQEELQLLQHRAELLADADHLSNDEINTRQAGYRAELDAERALDTAQKERENSAQAMNATLDAQKQVEISMAGTAAERLAIEQRYANAAQVRSGVPVTNEQLTQQANQRDLAVGDQDIQAVHSAADQFRDILAQAGDEGGKRFGDNLIKSLRKSLSHEAFEQVSSTISLGIFGKGTVSAPQGGLASGVLDIFGADRAKKKAHQATNNLPGVPVAASPSLSGALSVYKAARVGDSWLGGSGAPDAPISAPGVMPSPSAPGSPIKAPQAPGLPPSAIGAGVHAAETKIAAATFRIDKATLDIEHADGTGSGHSAESASVAAGAAAAAKGGSGSPGSSASGSQIAGLLLQGLGMFI